MGHQETMATGSALRRILLVLAVAAVMAVMMVASAMPAFADKGGIPNGGNQGGEHHGHQHGTFSACNDTAGDGLDCGLHRGN